MFQKDGAGKSPAEVVLVYDGQCPACSAYCRMTRLRQSAGTLRMIDAREDNAITREIRGRHLKVDSGMVLKVDEVFYSGADAIHALALLSSRSDRFNRATFWVFRSRSRSRVLYPILRLGRYALLKLLGREQIDAAKSHH